MTETRNMTPLQWQLMMKCWKMNLRPGQYSWWAPTAWRVQLWAWKLRKINGKSFTWPLMMFASALPKDDGEAGQTYLGKPLSKSRKDIVGHDSPRINRSFQADMSTRRLAAL